MQRRVMLCSALFAAGAMLVLAGVQCSPGGGPAPSNGGSNGADGNGDTSGSGDDNDSSNGLDALANLAGESAADLIDLQPLGAPIKGSIIDGITGQAVGGADLYVYRPPGVPRQDATLIGQLRANSAGLFAVDPGTADEVQVVAQTQDGLKSGDVIIDPAEGFFDTRLSVFAEGSVASHRQLGAISIYPNPVLAEITDYNGQIHVPEVEALGHFPTFVFYASAEGVGNVDARGFFYPFAPVDGYVKVQYGSALQATNVHVRPYGTFGSAQGDVVRSGGRPAADVLVIATLNPDSAIDLSTLSFAARTDTRGIYVFQKLPPGSFMVTAVGGIEARQATVVAAQDTLVEPITVP